MHPLLLLLFVLIVAAIGLVFLGKMPGDETIKSLIRWGVYVVVFIVFCWCLWDLFVMMSGHRAWP